jgi:hypothetical protein
VLHAALVEARISGKVQKGVDMPFCLVSILRYNMHAHIHIHQPIVQLIIVKVYEDPSCLDLPPRTVLNQLSRCICSRRHDLSDTVPVILFLANLLFDSLEHDLC